jgi:hypothetical protein
VYGNDSCTTDCALCTSDASEASISEGSSCKTVLDDDYIRYDYISSTSAPHTTAKFKIWLFANNAYPIVKREFDGCSSNNQQKRKELKVILDTRAFQLSQIVTGPGICCGGVASNQSSCTSTPPACTATYGSRTDVYPAAYQCSSNDRQKQQTRPETSTCGAGAQTQWVTVETCAGSCSVGVCTTTTSACNGSLGDGCNASSPPTNGSCSAAPSCAYQCNAGYGRNGSSCAQLYEKYSCLGSATCPSGQNGLEGGWRGVSFCSSYNYICKVSTAGQT